ncbi:MAG: Serine protease, subtilase family, partial [Verrucomicrobiales bacterium]|nr:Serine protease, subtilase family [Verrucomicrobiales bacterium]
ISLHAPGWFGVETLISILDDDSPPEPFRPFPPNLSSNVPVSTWLAWKSGDGELIINGDFELGTFEGWTLENTGTGGFVINDGNFDPQSPDGPLPPSTGNFSALSNPSGSGRHVLYQDVFIPPSASTVTLRWDQRIRNHGSSFGSNQQFRVEIRNLSNALLRIAFASNPGDPLLGGWTSRFCDLSDFRGASVRIAFVEEDSTAFLNAHVDNVSLIADSSTPLSYEVYLGTSAESGGDLIGTTTDTFWILPELAPLTTYYWHVISRGIGETSGPLWSFSTRGVDHFSWDSLQATQRVGQPFPITISARDEAGSVITNFHASVTLSGASLGPNRMVTAPVNVTPTVLSGFSNGTWSGSVSVLEPSPSMILTVSDAQNHLGTSQDISVFEQNDLSVSLSSSSSSVATGTEIIYTIVCYNSGPLPASGVVLSASLPAAASLNALAITQGACTVSGQDVICDVGNLEGDGSVVLTVDMNPGPEGTISTTAWASRLENEPYTANNSASLTTDVIPVRIISVMGASATENEGAILFKILMDQALNAPVTIQFSTIDGTATAGLDYVATNGTVIIPPGGTQAVVPVKILHDFRNEPAEIFYLSLVSVTNAFADIGYAEGTILDNDPQPALSGLDALTRAPAAGETNILFPVVLSNPSGYEVSVDFTTSDGTALAGTDYSPTNGTITFPPGVTNLLVSVRVVSSFSEQTSRVFYLDFSNQVHADLVRPRASGVIGGRNLLPAVSLANATVTEGASGKTDASFSLSLSFPSTTNVGVAFQTQAGTATPGADYDTTSGTIVFLPGQVAKVISVPVRGDTLDEDDETFSVILLGITNAIAGVTNATGTILNDDPHPFLSFGNVTVNSLSLMDTEVFLPITLDAASGRTVTVTFQTRDGSALAGLDYGATNGTVQFFPGVTNALLRLRILKDQAHEPSEIFYVDFSNPLNVLLNTPSAVITITHSADGIGTLDHFQWSTILSPQYSNYPIAATLSARDAQNQIIQDFNSPVTLSALIPEAPLEVGSGTIPAVFPLGSFYQDSRSQIFYPSSEVGTAKRFSALSLQLASSTGLSLSNWVIRLKHTASSTNLFWQSAGWQTVFQGSANLNTSGWVTFQFLEPFAYNGTNHLLIDLSFDNDSSGVDAQCFSRETSQPRSLFYRSDGANGNPLSWVGNNPQGFSSSLVPNLRLVPTPVSLPISPSLITQWNNGSFTGLFAISSLGTNVQIAAEAQDGHNGWSNPFDVKGNSPLIALSSPAPGTSFEIGSPINLSAFLSDSVGIQRVDFFADNILLAQVTQPPYLFAWNNPPTGSHTLRAAAYAFSGISATSAPVNIVVQSGNYFVYKPPAGGWTYLYNGDAVQAGLKGSPVLDGTWDHNNPSSEWDGLGRGPGLGSPGGISTDGKVLTIEDAVSAASGAGNNRSLLFTRGLNDFGVTNASRILDNGVTLTFRARLTPGTIAPAAEMNLPNGYGIFDGGKGNFGVRQAGGANAGLISFSLVQRVEESETSSPIVFPSSGLVVNRLNGDHATNDVDSASRGRLNFLWSLPPGSRPYLTSGNSERNLAYNPVTGHLLLLSRASAVGGLQIPVLNASNGAEVGKLSTNGIAGGSSVLNGIGVADDGAIYAANLVTLNNSSNSAFRIYRWAYESAIPTLAFSGEILNGQRWGDTLDVRGSGPDTQLLAGSGSGTNKAVVFVTANGLNFTPVLLDSTGSVSNGDFRTALAFGPGNTFFARQFNSPLLQMGFDLLARSATSLRVFGNTAFPAGVSSISVDPNLRLMAGVTPAPTATNAAYIELFDLDSLAPDLPNQGIDRQNFSPANANSLALSSVHIGGGKVFALDSNNGLLACDLSVLPGTVNLLPLDPTLFHEFWITIQGNQGTSGNGTHTVSIYTDGATNPSVFHVTAGTGADLSSTSPLSTNFTTALATNYLGLGCPSSLAVGAIDVDYFGYKQGIFAPTVANASPVLGAIADRIVHAGTTVTITNQASDLDAPNGPFTFTLDAAPPGAFINSATGVFTWSAPDSQTPTTNFVSVRVTDSGVPRLSDTKFFRVIVLGRPRANTTRLQGGTIQLSWNSIPGQRYRVVFKNNLNEPDWQPLVGDVTALGTVVNKTDSSASGGQRFYQILVVP